MIDFGDSHIVAGANAPGQALDHPPFVLEGCGRVKVDLEGQKADFHVVPLPAMNPLLTGPEDPTAEQSSGKGASQ